MLAVERRLTQGAAGGGYCLGDLTTDAEWCMLARSKVGIVVVDVDYRLTPGEPSKGEVMPNGRRHGRDAFWAGLLTGLAENPFGKCFEDCWAAVQWVLLPPFFLFLSHCKRKESADPRDDLWLTGTRTHAR